MLFFNKINNKTLNSKFRGNDSIFLLKNDTNRFQIQLNLRRFFYFNEI
jgi:hypothetical protein